MQNILNLKQFKRGQSKMGSLIDTQMQMAEDKNSSEYYRKKTFKTKEFIEKHKLISSQEIIDILNSDPNKLTLYR